ncbi:transketolase [Candidatus Woesearchaeota archaeon]|nr:MAG: transketolase [Candidatus Woesearchaeota archaeon]
MYYKIANLLRRDVVRMTTAAGSGHPSSCLSCAEIMALLFFKHMRWDPKKYNNVENDEFILSKGHAAPILYSCLKHAGAIHYDLMKLRQKDSPLEGHPMPNSLKWVKVATGSLGQGLSNGVGVALAAKKLKLRHRTYVLLGDSELAEGSVYEALQLAAYYNLKNLCAIVDVNRLGQTGETMHGHRLNEYKKIFSSFGWNAVVVEGHDVKQLDEAFLKAKKSDKPFVILARTIKGKGLPFMEDKNGWHGKPVPEEMLSEALNYLPESKMPKFNIKKPVNKKILFAEKRLKNLTFPSSLATRKAYGMALANLAQADDSVVALDAEVSNSTYSINVKQKKPKQFVECFIAEQNMVGMALGLSVKGFNVFCSSFASFLTRAHDQIRMAALSGANMTIVGSHSGVSIGQDGASQMGLEDLAMMRALPGSVVFYPSDAKSTEKIVYLCKKLKGIKYIRTTRADTFKIYRDKEVFKLGDFKVLRSSNNDKGVLIGAGITLYECLKAYNILNENGTNVAVVDLYCLKPLDEKKLKQFLRKHGKKCIVVEDHYAEGGMSDVVYKALANTDVKVKNLSVTKIPHSGTKQENLKMQGIDGESIAKAFFKL